MIVTCESCGESAYGGFIFDHMWFCSQTCREKRSKEIMMALNASRPKEKSQTEGWIDVIRGKDDEHSSDTR